MGVSAGDIRRWEEQGLDHSSPKLSKYQWDVQGQRLASQFPDLGWGEGYSEGVNEGGHDAKLWALLKEGKVDPPSRQSEEFHADVDEYLQYLASQSPGGLDDAPDAEDTSFDFGALAEDDATRFGLDVLRLARQRAFTVAGDIVTDTIEAIRDELAADIQEGTSLVSFRKRIRDRLDGSPIGPWRA